MEKQSQGSECNSKGIKLKMEKEEEYKCSFCGRPQRLVLYLIKGPRGFNICDLCVLEAKNKVEPVETGPWGSECSFCGRHSDEVPIMLMSEEAGICANCVEESNRTVEKVVGKGAEFLSAPPPINDKEKLEELKSLALEFQRHFKALQVSFLEENIDWTSHNLMAQAIIPLKGKAALMKLNDISEMMWEIEELFKSIRFDDVETNRDSVVQLESYIERMVGRVLSMIEEG